MRTTVAEIAPSIYRLSTFVPTVGPTGFTFNQFLIDADEPHSVRSVPLTATAEWQYLHLHQHPLVRFER